MASHPLNVRVLPTFDRAVAHFFSASLNIVELLINVLYLYSTYVLDSPIAPLFGFSTNLMTISKTVLYLAQEYFCGYCNIGHNNAKDIFFFYICTNG